LLHICTRQANLAFWEVKQRLKRSFRNDSIEEKYTWSRLSWTVFREKVAYLKERAGTLVFQLHYTINSCGVYLQPLR